MALTTKVDSDIINSFWNLSDLNSKERFQSAEKIVNILKSSQAKANNNEISNDLTYCIDRLIKGLVSSRDGSRQGYIVLLTELLSHFESIKAQMVIDLVEKHLPISGTKLEIGNSVIGRSLAYGALIRSSRLKSETSAIKPLLDSLNSLSNQRSYIHSAVCLLLKELIHQLPDKKFSKYVLSQLQDDLSKGWDNCTPDRLFLLLICQRIHPNCMNNLLDHHWGGSKIISNKNYLKIGAIMRSSTLAHPLIHPVCLEVTERFVNDKKVEVFWKQIVNDVLLEPNQFESTFLAFEILKKLVMQMNSKELHSVLSVKLREVMIKSLRVKHHPLTFASEELCKSLVYLAQTTTDPEIQMEVVMCFVTPPGTFLFDSVTRNHFLSLCISHLKPAAVVNYSTVLANVLLGIGNNEMEKLKDSVCCLAAKQLSHLLHQPGLETEWKIEQLFLLFVLGFFNVNKISETIPGCSRIISNIPVSVRESCKLNFLKGLESFLKPKEKEGYRIRLRQHCESLLLIANHINSILKSSDEIIPVSNMGKITKDWKSMFKVVKEINSSYDDEERKDEVQIFQILLLHLGIQLFYGDPKTKENLEELKECSKRAFEDTKGKKNKGPEWIDVLVDIFLSLLSNETHFMSLLISSLFPLLCQHITVASLQPILDVLNSENNEEILEDDEGEDGEKEEDVVFESGSSSEDESEEEASEETEALRAKLRKALGQAADDEEEEETYLSDSTMFKLDDAISEAFKGRMKKPKKKVLEEQTLLNMRLRSLVLLVKYFKSDPPLDRAVHCLLPLINLHAFAIKNKNQQILVAKSKDALKSLLQISKNSLNEDLKQETLKEILEQVFAKIRQEGDNNERALLGNVCSFLVQCSKKIYENSSEKTPKAKKIWFAEMYKELLLDWMKLNTIHLNPDLFVHFVNCYPESARVLLKTLSLTALNREARLFKKTQALNLSTSIAKIASGHSVISNERWLGYIEGALPQVSQSLDLMSHQPVKPLFLFELMSFTETVVKIRNKIEPPPDYSELIEALQKYSANNLDKERRYIFRRLCNLLKIPISGEEKKGKKRKRKSEKIPQGLTNGNSSKEELLEGDREMSNLENNLEQSSEVETHRKGKKKDKKHVKKKQK